MIDSSKSRSSRAPPRNRSRQGVTEIRCQRSTLKGYTTYLNFLRNDADQCGVLRRSHEQRSQRLMCNDCKLALHDIGRQSAHGSDGTVIRAVDRAGEEKQHFICVEISSRRHAGYRNRSGIPRSYGCRLDHRKLNEIIQDAVINRLGKPLLVGCIGYSLLPPDATEIRAPPRRPAPLTLAARNNPHCLPGVGSVQAAVPSCFEFSRRAFGLVHDSGKKKVCAPE